MKFFRQFMLLTLTLLVLVSSTGITVGKHLCGGELQNLRLFIDAKDCPMEQKKQTLPPCHNSGEGSHSDQKTPADCCQDTKTVLESIDYNVFSKTHLGSNNFDLKFVATAHFVLAHLLFPEATATTTHLAYAAPPIVRDIPVLVQSFLI